MIEIKISASSAEELLQQIAEVYCMAALDNTEKLNSGLIKTAADIEEAPAQASAQQPAPVPEIPAVPSAQAPAQQPAPVVPTAAPVVPTATASFSREQIGVACVGLVDKLGGPQPLVDLLQQQFGVSAITDLQDSQLDAFVLAIRQMGATI